MIFGARLGRSAAAEIRDPDQGRDRAFAGVRERYRARDAALGRTLFSAADWARTRIAFDLLEGARSIVDVGIGQGQLVNLLLACPETERVCGVDFQRHSKLIEPEDPRFSFRRWNVTEPADPPIEPADVAVAMEILEHVEVEALADALARIRALSRSGTVLVSVPWRERPPLYHHDRPHGHKQSFDDAAIARIFGPALVSTHAERWYLLLLSEHVEAHRLLAPDAFRAACRAIVRRAVADPDRRIP
jgi:hypothetical protein